MNNIYISIVKNIVKRSILKVYKVYFFISKLKKRFDGRFNHHHQLITNYEKTNR